MLFIFIYLFILCLGVLAHFYFVQTRINLLVSNHNMRSRMRYELNQDVNNVLVEYKKFNNHKYSEDMQDMHTFSSSNLLLDYEMDKTIYFVDHIEKIVSHSAKEKLILYKIKVDPEIYRLSFSLSVKYELIHLIVVTMNRNESSSLRFSLEKKNDGIVFTINSVQDLTKIVSSNKKIRKIKSLHVKTPNTYAFEVPISRKNIV